MDLRGSVARGTDTAWYKGWDLTAEERAVFRATTVAAQQAKARALRGECEQPKHPINVARLDPRELMPRQLPNGLRALSLFSGGGGMDIGFDRAGYEHVGHFEIMADAAQVLQASNPDWHVHGGLDGDVTRLKWGRYKGKVDVLHGGPPCQPFSHAGRRNGADDARDMIPELVRAVKAIQPQVFVLENVSGLLTKRFAEYIQTTIHAPLERKYTIRVFRLEAAEFGVPQRRRRVFFVGFKDAAAAAAFQPPAPTHSFSGSSGLPKTMGAREALGLPDIGVDGLAPTIRSGLTGPRHTTSVLNSVTAQRAWNDLQIWPNGVAESRERASGYVAKNGHFRLSIQDCLVLQGFPPDWPITRPVYFALGLIGNSVAPPMSYHLARAIQAAVQQATL